MNAAYAAALPEGGRPVRTCVGVTALVRGALIEIEAVAKRP
jgi:enamine deaminase RidA (YjgF/YER057c/UK114 family)